MLLFYFSENNSTIFFPSVRGLSPTKCENFDLDGVRSMSHRDNTQMATEMLCCVGSSTTARRIDSISIYFRFGSIPREPNPRLVIPGAFSRLHTEILPLLFYSADYGIAVALAIRLLFRTFYFPDEVLWKMIFRPRSRFRWPSGIGEQTARERNSPINHRGHCCCFDCFAKQTNGRFGFRCVRWEAGRPASRTYLIVFE